MWKISFFEKCFLINYCKRKLAITIVTSEIYHPRYVKIDLLKQIPCAYLCTFHVKTSHLLFNFSKLAIEALEKNVKYVHS